VDWTLDRAAQFSVALSCARRGSTRHVRGSVERETVTERLLFPSGRPVTASRESAYNGRLAARVDGSVEERELTNSCGRRWSAETEALTSTLAR